MTRTHIYEHHARICQLRREGLQLIIIAERVGLSLKQVQHVLTRNKVYRWGVRL